jgi:hypothetical protein
MSKRINIGVQAAPELLVLLSEHTHTTIQEEAEKSDVHFLFDGDIWRVFNQTIPPELKKGLVMLLTK